MTEVKQSQQEQRKLSKQWLFEYAKDDLFRVAASIPGCGLAHCVSQDLVMNAGIAKTFRHVLDACPVTRNEWEADLKSQGCKVGRVAVCPIVLVAARGQEGSEKTGDKMDPRWAFHLVTKRVFRDKPKFADLKLCLKQLLTECRDMQLTDVAIPHLGAGLDRLQWKQVLACVKRVFVDGAVRVHVVQWSGSCS
jgi:O-acetyl-ADP-ribose deacetylase (regulator of RNase III)